MTMAHRDVVAVLGPADEALIAEFTDPNAEELSQAWAWRNSDEALIGEGRPLPSGKWQSSST
jgi:hypothetical protein